MRSARLLFCIVTAASVLRPSGASAQTSAVTADHRLTVYGFLQTQYERTRRGEDDARDRVFFRRAVIGLRATVTQTWLGVAQVDLGPAVSNTASRVLMKDAYVQYTGLARRGLTLTLGSQKTPFSRSALESAQRRSLVERPFTGDKSFGSPGRLTGLKAEGWHAGHRVYWAAGAGASLHSPDPNQIRIDHIGEADADWNEGVTTAARVEVHPLGETPRDQGSFGQALRYTIGAAVYDWRNDGERNTHPVSSPTAADAARSGGLEISGGLRGGAVSIDAEYERVAGRATDARSTAGLYRNGTARVRKFSLEAGYMLHNRVELLGAWDRLAVDAFASAPRRAAAGVNWYIDRHNLKFQAMHRDIVNNDGTPGARGRSTYLQAQFMF